MSKIKQHYMIRMKRGECHPIFSREYLPENIASLVETAVLFTESLLAVFFVINFLINGFESYAMAFVPTLIIDAFAIDFFKVFGVDSTQDSNFIAFLLTLSSYYVSFRYFEFVKYNLHPKPFKKFNLNKKKGVKNERLL